MAGFDDLIRGALEKQGNPTAERRSAIYHSSRQALERMLSQNTGLDAKTASAQRDRLEQAISGIEKDYAAPLAPPIPAPTPAPAPVPVTAPSLPPIPAPIPAPKATPVLPTALPQAPMPEVVAQKPVTPVAPEVKAAAPVKIPPVASTVPAAPVVLPDHLEPQIGVDAGSTRLEDYAEPYRGDALKEKKSYAKLFLWTIILVGLGVAAWWAINFGPALLKQQFDGSVPNPATRIESGSFVPEGGEGWVSAFSPLDDSQNIDSAGRGTVEIFQDGNRNFARIASNAGSTRNNLRIKIPRGVMQTLKGKAATFEMVIKNATDQPHQFAIFCEFGDMGSCGRKRFKVGKKAESFIFDVLVNDADLPENQEAFLSINTDLSSNGKPVDLYSVRIRTGQ
ncbi:MAG: hypothetical protein V3V02_06515 [Rhizobiaceae bacterium]